MDIAVFHLSFSNSCSLAEIVTGNIINVSRQVSDKLQELHNGIWETSHEKCCEIRGKCLGAIVYNQNGSQISILAETMGLYVIYHDIQTMVPLDTAKQISTLNNLLKKSDFVTLLCT